MFRRKRNNLFRRLWRCRASKIVNDPTNSDHDTARSPSSQLQSPSASINSESINNFLLKNFNDEQLKRTVYSLLKSISIKQLENLVKCIESRGGIKSNCIVTTSKVQIRHSDGTTMDVKFHVLLSCLFRWPDMIGEDYELKRLATCTTCIENDLDEITGTTPAPSDLHLVCINPHHYSRINLQESVPSPYVIYQLNDLPCDSTEADSSNPSISFDSAGKSFDDHSSYSSICKASFDSSWCAIAYWEFRERVGRIFDVKSSTVNIFQQLPEGEGFWLGALNRDGVSGNISNTDSNQCDSRVFHRIGYGLQLSREDDSVWIYNRSEHPLYVNSPLYNKNIQSTHNTEVKKVQPGYSLKVFNYARVDMPQQIRPYVGPRYPYSIRISFVKGWGRNYTRQFITSCPCWLEILLNVSH